MSNNQAWRTEEVNDWAHLLVYKMALLQFSKNIFVLVQTMTKKPVYKNFIKGDIFYVFKNAPLEKEYLGRSKLRLVFLDQIFAFI